MKIKISLLLCIITLTPGISLAETLDSTPREKLYPMESSADKTISTTDILCIKTSVSVREDAIAGAFKTFSDTMIKSLSMRKVALENAFSKSTAKERSEARKSARTEFKSASILAHKALSVAKKDAWATFKSSSRTCKGGSAEMKDESPSVARSRTEAL